MKTLKTLLSVAFLAVATSMSASNIVENASVAPASDSNAGWSKAFITYHASSLKWGGESSGFPGFSLGWVKGMSITNNMPLFVEAGAALEYRSDKEDDDLLNMMSINIPVNLVYKYDISEDMAIKPLIGIDLRLNMFGKLKSGGESVSIFSEDDMGPMKFGRFQAGWHLGFGFTYSQFEVGLTYGQDFNEIVEEGRIANTVISLGYNF